MQKLVLNCVGCACVIKQISNSIIAISSYNFQQIPIKFSFQESSVNSTGLGLDWK